MRKDRPLFSIIMPNYNKGKYIKESIESVLAQNFTNWELVIADDASTDNSLDVIKTFLNDRKIKLIRNETNKGVAYAAKQAVEASSGEIIGTLDSDDVLLEDALTVMVDEHMSNPGHGLIYSNHYKCDKDMRILGEAAWLDILNDGKCLQKILLERQAEAAISTAFRTFKRSAYNMTDGYDVTLSCYEDRDLYYKLEKVTGIKGINKCLYCYRDNNETGAYRNNSKTLYYWFVCEYKETRRKSGVNLPSAGKEKISPFLSNIMFMTLCKYSDISREKLRERLRYFLLETGYDNLRNNKLLAFLYFLNSFIYGYTPITLSRIKKFISHELPESAYIK
ncbi:MAG: glycosyltransferase family 2 protein [Nitrospirae bacterium]|nr:glycosyltransferase family 2 protein [Nitrospirota bacterium]